MFESLKLKYEIFKEKLAGARNSTTVWISIAWTTVSSNVEAIQAQLPLVQQYLGANVNTFINIAFAILLIYVRCFKTKGPVEDNAVPKTPKE